MLTLDEFFAGQVLSRQLFDALRGMLEELGPVELHVTKSQIAFRRDKAFAWVWMPGKYLRGQGCAAGAVRLLCPAGMHPRAGRRSSSRAPGRFTHHLELFAVNEIDDEVRLWLQVAWEKSSCGQFGA